MFLKSKLGEVKHIQQWKRELNEFWGWAEKQNRYIQHTRSKTHKREFKQPIDAFERYCKLLGLVPHDSYLGVF